MTTTIITWYYRSDIKGTVATREVAATSSLLATAAVERDPGDKEGGVAFLLRKKKYSGTSV